MAYDAGPDARSGLHKRAKKWRDRGESAFGKQTRWLHLWQKLAEIFAPELASFTTNLTDPATIYDGLFTSKPQKFAQTLAERIGSMTRAKGEQWFKLVAQPEELMERDDIKAWCEDATMRQRNVLYSAKSMFTVAMAMADKQYAIFGNSVVRYAYNSDRSGVYFASVHLRDCAWEESAEGIVDAVHERMKPRVSQLLSLFKREELPRAWQEMLDKPECQGDTVEFRRCVAPVDAYAYEEGEKKPRATAKFVSIYIAHGSGVKDEELGLREEYLDHFPYSVRRWMRLPGEVVAMSPAAGMALADGETLNTAEAAALKGIEFTADPALTAPDDGFIGEVRIQSGAMLYRNVDYDRTTQGDFIQAVPGGEAKTVLEYVQFKAIDMAKAFFSDMLQMPDREMTLGEFRQRFKNALRDASPIFEPIEADYATMQDGVFTLILNAHGPADPWGGFLPAPEELEGDKTRFEFQTALTEAFTELRRQEALEVQAQFQALAEMQSDAADHIDMDEVTRDSMANFKTKWTRKRDVVEERRAQRQEQQAAQAAEEKAAMVAEMAAKANPENMRMLKQDMEGAAQ
jgi:hypothetical protein